MFWAVHLSYACQNVTNFFFNKEVYTFCKLPQGYAGSPFIAGSATNMTYSNKTMMAFLDSKGWKLNSVEWPFSSVNDFLILYVDDLIIKTPKGIENDIKIHLRVLEFILFATKVYGFKISHGKCSVLTTNFKFLGHQFDTETESYGIPKERLKAIENFRSPRSCAETFSRLCTLSYHARFLPLYKIISLPLWIIANSGVFVWTATRQ